MRPASRAVVAATAVCAVAGLAGCGGSADFGAPVAPAASSVIPSAPRPTPATPSPTPSPAEEPTKDVDDCFDGRCVLLVSKPVKVPLDADEFHYGSFEIIDVTDDSLTFRVAYSGGGGAVSTMGVGGGGGFSFRGMTGISLRLASIDDGVATLVVTPDPG